MAKFKVGDVVRVKEDLEGGRHYNGVYFNGCMRRYCGRTYIVDKVFDTLSDTTTYRLKPRRGRSNIDDWYWSDDMLEVGSSKEFVSFLRGFKK